MRDPRPRQVGGFHAAPQTLQESVEVVRATLRLASGNGQGPRGTRASRQPGRRHRGRRSYGRTARAGERQPGRRGTSRARGRGGGVWPLPSSRRVSETARRTSQTPNGAEGRRTPDRERRGTRAQPGAGGRRAAETRGLRPRGKSLARTERGPSGQRAGTRGLPGQGLASCPGRKARVPHTDPLAGDGGGARPGRRATADGRRLRPQRRAPLLPRARTGVPGSSETGVR